MRHRHTTGPVRYRTKRGRIMLRKRPIHKYTIKIVSSNGLKGFGGMNYYAAKHLKFKPIPSKDEILIEKDNKNYMDSTILHEVTEANLMKEGMGFNQAHKKAMDEEIKAGYVPKKRILENNKWFTQNKARMSGWFSFGKFDSDSSDDPSKNPLHPDSLTKEQACRYGECHNEAAKFKQEQGGDVFRTIGGEHSVAVKDDKVYDSVLGIKGMDIKEYEKKVPYQFVKGD